MGSSSVEYIGDNGELVLSNPTKQKEGSKNFTFNKVFGPTTTQGTHNSEIFSIYLLSSFYL